MDQAGRIYHDINTAFTPHPWAEKQTTRTVVVGVVVVPDNNAIRAGGESRRCFTFLI